MYNTRPQLAGRIECRTPIVLLFANKLFICLLDFASLLFCRSSIRREIIAH